METETAKKTLCARLYEATWKPFLARYDIIETFNEDEDFFYGRQWPQNNVRNEVRITSNHLADLEYKRASKVAGTPIHFAYTASDDRVDCTKLSRFDKYVLSKMHHETFTFASALQGEAFGTAIAYLRYDSEGPWLDGGFYEGGLEEELISLRTFFVANPNMFDIQKQEYVGFTKDVYVGEIRDKLKSEMWSDEDYKSKLHDLYKEGEGTSSEDTDEFKDKDIINSKLVRLYTRFFRVDGEVCYEQATENVQVTKYPVPLSKEVARTFAKKVQEEFNKREEKDDEPEDAPDDEKRQFRLVNDLNIDFADTVISVHRKQRKEGKGKDRWSKYPFALFRPKAKHDFVFGRSITKEMIPLQRGVNVAMSLQLQLLYNMAFPKTFVRDGAMKSGERFSNRPEDNVQPDHYRGNGNGFYNLGIPSASADLYKIPDYFVGEMKDSYDAKDFANGDLSNMSESSGYAIQQMLKVANSALEQEQKAWWEFETELAEIRLLFYKHYFTKKLFDYEMTPTEYDAEERARKTVLNKAIKGQEILGPDNHPIPTMEVVKRYKEKTKKRVVEEFEGKNLLGVAFDVRIDAQQGIVQSELATSQWYQSMFANGGIQAFENNPELLMWVIQTAPPAVLPEEQRSNMLHYAEGHLNSYLQKLMQENAMLKQQLGQSIAMGKAQQEQFRENLGVANTLVKNAQADSKAAQKRLQDYMSEGQIKSQNAKGENTQAQMASMQSPII